MTQAKYQGIEELLLKEITAGKYKIGQLIPKEMDLAAKHNVSRPTVRHALQDLVNQGYLERKKHLGTIVKRNKIAQEFTHVIESYNHEMQHNGLRGETKVLFFAKINAPKTVAKAMKLENGTEVYKLTRLRYADREPVVLVTTFLPAKILPDFDNIDFNKQSLYQELAKCGLAIVHVKRKLEVKTADAESANLLDIDQNSPVFYFHTHGYSSGEQLLEYSIATYRGDLNYFLIDLHK